MRRGLPFDKLDLLALLKWCYDAENLSGYFAPIGHLTRALKRYASSNTIDFDLRDAMRQYAARLAHFA